MDFRKILIKAKPFFKPLTSPEAPYLHQHGAKTPHTHIGGESGHEHQLGGGTAMKKPFRMPRQTVPPVHHEHDDFGGMNKPIMPGSPAPKYSHEHSGGHQGHRHKMGEYPESHPGNQPTGTKFHLSEDKTKNKKKYKWFGLKKSRK